MVIASLCSCKKDKGGNGPAEQKVPVLNSQEMVLVGNWSIDSTSHFNASSVYQSHTLPSASMEPKIAFFATFDCSGCSDVGFYKAAKGTTPGNFTSAVWSAQVTDTLRFGDHRGAMTPYKIAVLTGPALTLKLAAASGSYSLLYYHKTN